MVEKHEIFTKPLPQILDEMKARVEELEKDKAVREAEKVEKE